MIFFQWLVLTILSISFQIPESRAERDISNYRGITEQLWQKLPSRHYSDMYKVGTKVAVLAGSARSGRGMQGESFYTVNISAEEDPDLIADFNHLELLPPGMSLDGKFDHVVVELPGFDQVWSQRMYETASRLLKKEGILEVSFYKEVMDLNFVPAAVRNSYYLRAIADSYSYVMDAMGVPQPTGVLSDLIPSLYPARYSNRYRHAVPPEQDMFRRYALTILLQQVGFTPKVPEANPHELLSPVFCRALSLSEDSVFHSVTGHKYEYCYFQKS